MELFVFRHAEWERLYNNCSDKESDTPIPWGERRFIAESLVLMLLAGIYYIFYIPCMYSFWRNWRDEKGQPNPCYQIMFYISLVDMGALWIISFYSGGQFLAGTVYCSAPKLNYFIGEAVTCFVVSEAIADLILALNRCVDILSSYWSTKLFKGRRLWICWLLPATLYGIYYFMMSSPVVYNGYIIVFTNNPYIGFWDDHGLIYQNSPQLNIHQFTLFFGTPIVYTLFIICLIIKTTRLKASTSTKLSKIQKNAFYQVLAISIFNMIGGGIYHLIGHFPGIVSPAFMFLAHFAWVHIHGIPPVICLFFNQRVRNDVKLMFMKIFRKNQIGHINGVTIIIKPTLDSGNPRITGPQNGPPQSHESNSIFHLQGSPYNSQNQNAHHPGENTQF